MMSSERDPAATSWASSIHARLTMQSNRGRDTKPELLVRQALHGAGWRFRVNYRPLAADRRRSVDIAFTRRKVAILIDGCFWHGCPDHFVLPKTNREYWKPKIGRNQARDVETRTMLERDGWLVLRYWEHQPLADVLTDVEENLRRRP